MEKHLFLKQLNALLEDETDLIANLANVSAALNDFLEDINWVGFYLYKEDQLVLGPFQGHPACVRIPMNRGVCGKAATTRLIVRVSDVHAFSGHIACDSVSESEIVLPLIKDDVLIGVLDIDAPIKDRFSKEDEDFLQEVTHVLLDSIRI